MIQFGFAFTSIRIKKERNNEVLLYGTGNYIQYPVINQNGKEYEKEYVYVCVSELLCCIAEIKTTLQVNYTSI